MQKLRKHDLPCSDKYPNKKTIGLLEQLLTHNSTLEIDHFPFSE